MSNDYFAGDGSAESSSSRTGLDATAQSEKPSYMTVGSGSTSNNAAALMATLDGDSGYGTSIADDNTSQVSRSWRPGLTADTPGMLSSGPIPSDSERRHIASHVHQLYYNQIRNGLARSITHAIELLGALQQKNSEWPAQYPSVHEAQGPRHDTRPSVSQTRSSNVSGDLQLQADNVPLRPSALRRAATSVGKDSSAESSLAAQGHEPEEPERLISAQSSQEFSVLKLNMNVQGLTQAEIAHSMKKDSIALLLDGKINQTIRHLQLLRDRIEDTSSKVLVTGDLNAGKSTFCNALLRRKVLPEDQQPCTSIFCEVLDAKENGGLEEAHAVHKKAVYKRNDESTYDVYQLEELEKVVTDGKKYNQCKIYVKDIRSVDQSLLNNGVVDISIIDAPGLNSDSLKTTAVFARQEEIDVVVFVVSAANHFTLSAKEFIWNAAHEKAYLFIVVNGFDNIRDKERCKRMILEQVHGLSQNTFKESPELVHFVSSNAIPVAQPARSSPGGDHDPGPSGGSGGSGGPSNEFPNPDDEDEEDSFGKHRDSGSPKGKGKGKEKEKIQDFETLEASLRRFVLERRARSKLAPAKTYLSNVLTDLNSLATVNRDIAQAEFDHAVGELDKLEDEFQNSKKARTEVTDDLDKTIEETCSEIYSESRTIITNAINHVADTDLGIPYPGLLSAFDYGGDIKAAMLDQIASAVTLCEEKAKSKTIGSVNTIKNLGIIHVGDTFADLTFNPDLMFRGKRDLLGRQVDFDVEFADFFDVASLWESQDSKVASTGMALTVASVVGGRMVGGFGWVDGALGAVRVVGSQNMRRLIVPGLALTGKSCFPLFSQPTTCCTEIVAHMRLVILFASYTISSIASTLPRSLSRRISGTLQSLDYTHKNAQRISTEPRKILRYPAETLRNGLANSVRELGEKRDGCLKVKKESEVARKYFSNLLRESQQGKAMVEAVDLDGPAPGIAGAYTEGEL